MVDIFNKEKRSQVMSQIRASKNKTTELALISSFKEFGITGWRRGSKMTGKPDFIFQKLKTTVFVDGCFWHGHECQKRMPKTNEDFWLSKITRNRQRDEEVSKTLKDKGWHVIRIWECELKRKNEGLLLKKLDPLVPKTKHRVFQKFSIGIRRLFKMTE